MIDRELTYVLGKWSTVYKPKLDERYYTFHAALNLLHQFQLECPVIVETGTLRIEQNWSGDGQSTMLFGEFCRNMRGILYTVDISEQAISICKRMTAAYSGSIHYVVGDSVEFLGAFDRDINLLYLDSFDCDPNGDAIAAQKHQLREISIAYKKLARRALVLLDDNDFANGGKTHQSKLFLEHRGFLCILDEKQSLWFRP